MEKRYPVLNIRPRIGFVSCSLVILYIYTSKIPSSPEFHVFLLEYNTSAAELMRPLCRKEIHSRSLYLSRFRPFQLAENVAWNVFVCVRLGEVGKWTRSGKCARQSFVVWIDTVDIEIASDSHGAKVQIVKYWHNFDWPSLVVFFCVQTNWKTIFSWFPASGMRRKEKIKG